MAKNAAERKVEVDIDQVSFGIEIECAVPRAFVDALGFLVSYSPEPLPAPFPSGWKVKKDGSVYASNYQDVPMEIVSPVLKGRQGLEEVLAVYQILNAAGFDVNDTCGLHVHVGVRSVLGERANDYGLVTRWVRRMLHLVSRHEEALFAITGRTSRLHNCYCQSVRKQWDESLKPTSPITEIEKKADSYGERFYTLNVTNLFIAGESKYTVEFRIFGATKEGIQVLGYIVTALGIAQRAAEVGQVAQFVATETQVTRENCSQLVGELQGVLAHYGWPTGARKVWGSQVRKVQLASAAKFAEDLAAGRLS